MIINIRGSHGTGKTHLVRRIIKHFGIEKKITRKGRVLGYKLQRKRKLYVVGNYEGNLTAAGCDVYKNYKNLLRPGFNQADLICQFIRKRSHPDTDIVFEGVVVSGGMWRWAELAKELKGIVFAVLDTPLEKCIRRVNSRRAERGKGPLEDLFHIKSKHRSLQANKENLRKAGCTVATLNHKKAFKTVRRWLREGYGGNNN